MDRLDNTHRKSLAVLSRFSSVSNGSLTLKPKGAKTK
ncbi:hypothetical protein E2C01_072071 [Portunus trituberculatus]|uniref:Uncharacterized protein n=1 Tax=Portunus trituberculatus TaxID=210409 RepID=A0A5B7I5M8_PORTR|nr:hypothetical protein [Portunus trituberculatus]